MNNPFKLKPGRGNMKKTGNGLPEVLLQTKTENARAYINKSQREGITEKQRVSDVNFASGTPGTGIVSGTGLNPKTNQVSPKAYEKKLVTQKNGDTFIVDGAGKTVEMAKYNAFKPEAVEALKKKYNKTKAETDDARTANSMLQNERANRVGGFRISR